MDHKYYFFTVNMASVFTSHLNNPFNSDDSVFQMREDEGFENLLILLNISI